MAAAHNEAKHFATIRWRHVESVGDGRRPVWINLRALSSDNDRVGPFYFPMRRFPTETVSILIHHGERKVRCAAGCVQVVAAARGDYFRSVIEKKNATS